MPQTYYLIDIGTANRLTEEQIARLEATTFQIADLSGTTVARAAGDNVTIDIDAAGNGWFIDPTPEDDSEFGDTPPQGIDLLTAVMHELGHVLGLGHSEEEGDLMNEALAEGTRLSAEIDDDLLSLLAEAQ